MIYRFGDCELDDALFELRRSSLPVPIEPQVHRLLRYLIENRNRVVTRAELHETLWNGRVVADATLNSRVKAARSAIGDDGKAQTLIRTFHRTGYRFVAEVELEKTGPRLQTTSADVDRIVAEGDTLDNLELALPSQPSVAVLPFRIAGLRGTTSILADGLTHDVSRTESCNSATRHAATPSSVKPGV